LRWSTKRWEERKGDGREIGKRSSRTRKKKLRKDDQAHGLRTRTSGEERKGKQKKRILENNEKSENNQAGFRDTAKKEPLLRRVGCPRKVERGHFESRSQSLQRGGSGKNSSGRSRREPTGEGKEKGGEESWAGRTKGGASSKALPAGGG